MVEGREVLMVTIDDIRTNGVLIDFLHPNIVKSTPLKGMGIEYALEKNIGDGNNYVFITQGGEIYKIQTTWLWDLMQNRRCTWENIWTKYIPTAGTNMVTLDLDDE
jgi:hypothetical protein